MLTTETRVLLAINRNRNPSSVAELAEITDQSEPYLLRTLERLRDAGLVRIEHDGSRRVPTAVVNRIIVEIDPFSANDRMHSEPA